MKKTNIIKRIWTLCSPFHWYIAGILILLAIQQIIVVAFPFIIGKMITSVVDGNKNVFVIFLSIWIMLAIARIIFMYIREKLEVRHFDYALSRHLSAVSLKKYFEISMGEHHIGHSLIKRSVVSKGEQGVSQMVTMTIYEIIPISLTIILPLVFIFVNAPLVGVVSVVAIIIFCVYTLWYNKKFVSQLREHDTTSNEVGKKRGEIISNADTVYVHSQEYRVQKESNDAEGALGTLGKSIWIPYIGWYHSGQIFLTIIQAACLGFTGYLTYSSQLGAGMFVSMTMWIGASLSTLGSISHIQRNITKQIAPLKKYFGFLDYETDIRVKDNPVDIGDMKGNITFDDVHFTYQPRTETLEEFDEDKNEPEEPVEKVAILKGVSFTLEAGKRYAFVGRSGAGKSTLISLILRTFDPKKGRILIDGHDLRDVDFRKLRQKIGYVPQEITLFDGSLKYNVAFGLEGDLNDIALEKLQEAARLSRLSELVSELEKGWDTQIGERGIKLSGGQRQRVGIARALIKDPAILIFDEATSNLDTENEQGIQESIDEASRGKTTIIIAHRLATVMNADEILVFDQGTLVGKGTHQELLKENPHYQNLVKRQVFVS